MIARHKVSILAVACILAVSVANVHAFNQGRPHCRQLSDFMRGWSVKNNPSRYWECVKFAVSVQKECEPGTEFSEQYLMCIIPGMIVGEIDPDARVQCQEGQVVDLSSPELRCVNLDCADGSVVYHPEGVPQCYRDGVAVDPHIEICPGSPESTRTPGTETCAQPQCDQAAFNSGKFWPSRNPHEYFRCASVGVPKTFRCSEGLCFHAAYEACVWPSDWQNACSV